MVAYQKIVKYQPRLRIAGTSPLARMMRTFLAEANYASLRGLANPHLAAYLLDRGVAFSLRASETSIPP
jgi:hypothetical protein